MSGTTTLLDEASDVLDEVTKGAFDLDWNRVLRFGNLLGLALVFVALSGMPVGLDGRAIIDGVVSLGYLSRVVGNLGAAGRELQSS